jgi:predicted TIM-barrel fold metal-dependent hydrolase
MATWPRTDSGSLAGKLIDVHTHVGLNVAGFFSGNYPYCQSVEDLLYRLNSNGVDCAVAFPLGACSFFDTQRYLIERRRVPSSPRIGAAPYAIENRMLCAEVYEKIPEAVGRILPFAGIDPGRFVGAQIRALEALLAEYPVYGLKAVGVSVQSSHRHLTGKGQAFLRLAAERNLPVLLHSTSYAGDSYSHNRINLAVARAFPQVRFCLAHCLGFDRVDLDAAAALPNVWVDSAAMKIQVEPEEILAPLARRFVSEYSDYRRVFSDLVRTYPDTMVWGSDSPAYSYMEKRRYADGSMVNFVLRGTYEQERAALAALTPAEAQQTANTNTRRFLFGSLD